MGAKQFAYVLITSLLFLKLALASSSAETFEIKFSPSGDVYRITLSEDRRLYDCVLHNVAIINRSNSPIVLQRIELHLLRKDRKSTRLNSSHEWISYAVFCLKKKKIK